jgi:hypothetical protein
MEMISVSRSLEFPLRNMSISLSLISLASCSLLRQVYLKSSLVTVFYPRENTPKTMSISPGSFASLFAILITISCSHCLL